MSFVDLRYAVRRLAATPAFSAVVVGIVALGIGVNTAIVTLARLSVRELPVKSPETLVALRWARSTGGAWFSATEYAFVREHATAVGDIIATTGSQPLVFASDGAGEPRRVNVEFVSDNFFSMLGSAIGRGDGAVISHRFWQSALGGDSAVVGRSLRISGQDVVIAGVAPRGFGGVALGVRTPDLWLPLSNARSVPGLYVFGRLAPHRSINDASAEMTVLSRQLVAVSAAVDPRARLLVGPRALTGQDPSSAWLDAAAPMAGAVFVLLIACANLANLLLARGASRQKEIGIRLCLGAGRGRIVGQLLSESLLLAVIGGAAGVLVSWWTMQASLPLWPVDADLVRAYLAPDGRILLFALALSIGTTTMFGLLPALRATPPDLTVFIRDEGAGFGHRLTRSRLRSALMVVQVALCTVLLLVAGLFLRAVDGAHRAPLGYDAHRIVTADIKVAANGYDAARTERLFADLADRLQARPGIESVSRVARFPLNGSLSTTVNSVRGSANAVSDRFFDTLGIPIVRGRAFTAREREADEAVAVVTEATARALWPDADPIGQGVRVGTNAPLAKVVGIARNARIADPLQDDGLLVYVPFEARHDAGELGLVIRVPSETRAAVSAVRDELKAIDPGLMAAVGPLDDRLSSSESYRVAAGASAGSGALGMLALVLAAVGLYGLVSFAVNQRTREIGVRVALGASRFDVLRLILGQAMRPVGIGIVAGGLMTAATARLISARLVGVPSFDPIAYGSVISFLAGIAAAASLIPALRASRLDPIDALRRA